MYISVIRGRWLRSWHWAERRMPFSGSQRSYIPRGMVRCGYTIPAIGTRRDVQVPRVIRRLHIESVTYALPLKTSIIFGDTYAQIDKLINDDQLRARFLQVIASKETFSEDETAVIFSNFINLIDIVNGFPDPAALELMFELWESIMTKSSPNTNIGKLQQQFLGERNKLVHIIINTRNYAIYETMIIPTLHKFKSPKTWADRLASTFQLQYVHGKLSVNTSAILKFLRQDHPIEAKRQLLATLLKTGILNGTDEEKYKFVSHFLSGLQVLGDDHFLFTTPEYQVYHNVLQIMMNSTPFLDNIERIQTVFNSLELQPNAFYNFMSSSMVALQNISPNNVLNIWKYKIDTAAELKINQSVLYDIDLKQAMLALCTLRLYPEVLELYRSYPELHTDTQIEVLLRVSEESKDWKLLQNQFEDMYGRGELPYVVHYGIVMKALANIGARSEVDQLFAQLNKRKLVPDTTIFAALIQSRLFDNDLEGAKICFQQYLDTVDGPKSSAYLYGLVFKIHLKMNNLDSAMQFLQETAEQQKRINIQLIDESSLVSIVDFAVRNYGLKQLEQIRTMARELNLQSEKFYVKLIRAYIRLDQFEIADKLVYEAHQRSPFPFANAAVYACQLQLNRLWVKSLTDSSQKHALRLRLKFIAKLVLLKIHEKRVQLRNSGVLLKEVVEYYVERNNLESANEAIRIAKSREVLHESHFIPLLKHYAIANNYASNGQILKLYRRMTDERIEVSSRTYVYLMTALIYLDSKRNNDFESAFRLLRSVMEMNGLTIKPGDPQPTVLKYLILERSGDLCRIVLSFVMTSSDQQNKIDLLVHFLNQMKEILGDKLSNEFKFTVIRTMTRIYQTQGKYVLAGKLVDTGLADLTKLITVFNTNYPFKDREDTKIPRSLAKEYRALADAKYSCVKATGDKATEYLAILNEAETVKIRLSGNQYNRLIKKVTSPTNLPVLFSVVEQHLIAGNWVEVKIMRKLQYMYKLVLLHLSNGDDAILENYSILNRFYGIQNGAQLRRELANVSDPKLKFEAEFYIHKPQLTLERWNSSQAIWNLGAFFVPERRIASQNILSPSNCSRLWSALKQYCGNDKHKAFALMDEYPETMEFLLFNDVARVRLQRFRRGIDRIVAPRDDYQETFLQRRTRTLEALSSLNDDNSHKQTFEQYTAGIDHHRYDRY